MRKKTGNRRSATTGSKGLLISVVKGVAEVEQEKYQLPELEQWYGFSARLLDNEISDEELAEKKRSFEEISRQWFPVPIF